MAANQQSQSKSINPLLECSASVFALMAKLRRNAGDKSLEDLKTHVDESFDTLEKMALSRQIEPSAIHDTKYALAAFVDETVLASAYPARLEWMSNPLQLKYFGEHLAGENFFANLNRLRQGGERNLHLLELYYTCMQMGFEGMYRMRGIETLMALQVDLRSQIEGYRGALDPRLAPDAMPKSGIIARVSQNVPYWVIGIVTLGVLFFSYGGYTLLLSNTVSTTTAMIEQDVATMSAYAEDGKTQQRSVTD